MDSSKIARKAFKNTITENRERAALWKGFHDKAVAGGYTSERDVALEMIAELECELDDLINEAAEAGFGEDIVGG